MTYQAAQYKPVAGYEGRYLVNLDGQIARIWQKGLRPIKTVAKPRGDSVVRLTASDGRRYEYKVSKIVVQAFKPMPRSGLVLMHINGVKNDNHVGNLEWTTRQQLGRRTGAEAKRKPVCKIDQSGNEVAFYASARSAAKDNHMSYQSVLDRCHGKVKKPYALDGCNYQFDRSED